MLATGGYVRCFTWLGRLRSWMLAILVLGFLVSLGHPQDTERTLSVTISPTESGTVIGPGIDCPATCSANFAEGNQVTLTATPNPVPFCGMAWRV